MIGTGASRWQAKLTSNHKEAIAQHARKQPMMLLSNTAAAGKGKIRQATDTAADYASDAYESAQDTANSGASYAQDAFSVDKLKGKLPLMLLSMPKTAPARKASKQLGQHNSMLRTVQAGQASKQLDQLSRLTARRLMLPAKTFTMLASHAMIAAWLCKHSSEVAADNTAHAMTSLLWTHPSEYSLHDQSLLT